MVIFKYMKSPVQKIDDIKRFQKPHDSIFSKLFTRRLSRVFTFYALRVKFLTPNVVSLISLVLALIAVGLFFSENIWIKALAVALLQLSFVLDCADGEIARARDLGSTFGAFLDSSFDRIKEAAMLGALTWIAFLERETVVILWIGFGAVIGLQLISFLREAKKASWPAQRVSEIYITKTIYLGTVDVTIFAVSVAVLFGFEAELLLLIALASIPLIGKQFFSARKLAR